MFWAGFWGFGAPMKKDAFFTLSCKALLWVALACSWQCRTTDCRVCKWYFLLWAALGCFGLLWAALGCSCAFTLYFKALYSSPVNKYAVLHNIVNPVFVILRKMGSAVLHLFWVKFYIPSNKIKDFDKIKAKFAAKCKIKLKIYRKICTPANCKIKAGNADSSVKFA